MYYVLQVASGMEDKTEAYITSVLSDVYYDRCFHLTRHIKKKFHGRWMDIHEKLLPGYVFIVSDNVKGMYLELKKVPSYARLLGRDIEYFTELPDRDVEWLERLLGNDDITEQKKEAFFDKDNINEEMPWHEVALSKVSVGEGKEIKIISGPLKNMDGMIRKINLHKRIAEVEVEFMNRKTIVYLGIELLDNSKREKSKDISVG